MDKITTWKYQKQWAACSTFEYDQLTHLHSFKVCRWGTTKVEAISSLCEALMRLSEEIERVVHEVNINK